MLYTILAFFIILGFLIFVHELGHFLTARLMGVKAEEFGFGFPPRILGLVFNVKKKKWEYVKGAKEIKRKNTIYSLNWIPLGGFVKIKGEDGEQKKNPAPDSFTAKKIWQRMVILAAGVFFNFLAAAFILSLGFMLGLPQAITSDEAADHQTNDKIQIIEITPNSPAEAIGLKAGDEILRLGTNPNHLAAPQKLEEISRFLNSFSGEEIIIEVKRGDDIYRLRGTPRQEHAPDEGALGIVFTKTAIVAYPFFEAIKMGFVSTVNLTGAMLQALGGILRDLILTGKTKADVSGPVGIVVFTNQAKEMGLAYLIQFVAILSINLAIINILPLPALDGGRILFLLIEKIKKSPVSEEIERKVHLTGFYLLIAFMFFITVRDIFKFQDQFEILWEKILGLI